MLQRVEGEPEPDMTPMIDVVFLLIIFFLCIDFRVLESKLPAYLPKNQGTGADGEEPDPQIHVAIVCTARGTEEPRGDRGQRSYWLRGHAIQWRVGPRTIGDPEALKTELARIYGDRSTWLRDPGGSLSPWPVVVDPGPETTYGDVAQTLDAISAAGFGEIRFRGTSPTRGR